MLLFILDMSTAAAWMVGVASALLILPPVAHAGEDPVDPSEPTVKRQAAPPDRGLFPDAPGHHAVAFNLGLGSAVGLAGATYAFTFRAAEIELGVGRGISGWQTSGMLKVAFYGTPTVRLGAGAGLGYTSAAALSTRSIDSGSGTGTGNPVWLNVDAAAFEYWAPSHFFAAGAVGITKGLGNGTYNLKVANNCGRDECYQDLVGSGWLPQLRAAIGFWM